jgi:tetratricopeptide (TPR) repeat protein
MLRRCSLFLCLVCLGCHSLPAGIHDSGPELEAGRTAQARELWEKGQEAMKHEQPKEAIALYEQSLALDPSLTCNYLSLATAHLESGNEQVAGPYLIRYVESNPEHLSARAFLAELLLRLHRPEEARGQLERFVADAQEAGAELESPIIHSHSRLMEIAEVEENSYEVHLHRGIGLYLLARRRADLDDPDGELPADGLLWKAAQELAQAQALRPREARPCWYLYAVWHGLAQQQPARRWLRLGLENAPFSSLTPAEQRGLYRAGQTLQRPL